MPKIEDSFQFAELGNSPLQPLVIPFSIKPPKEMPVFFQRWQHFYHYLSPDIPREFILATGFSFLATVWGNSLYLPQLPPREGVQLWFLLLAPPAGLKSTAIRYLVYALNEEKYRHPLPPENQKALYLEGSWEGILTSLADHSFQSVLLFQDEIGPLLAASQGYKADLKNELTKLFGSHLSLTRRLRKSGEEVLGITVNLIAGIQPSFIAQIPEKEIRVGLMTRFSPLLSTQVPPPLITTRDRNEEEAEFEVIYSLREEMVNQTRASDEFPTYMDEEAKELYEKVIQHTYQWRAKQLDEIQSWLNRQELTLLKLSALSSIAENWNFEEFIIRPHHIGFALPFWVKIMNTIPTLASMMSEAYASRMARKIAEWLAEQPNCQATLWQIARMLHLTSDQASAILSAGEIQGLWTIQNGKRKDSLVIKLNEEFWE